MLVGQATNRANCLLILNRMPTKVCAYEEEPEKC